MPNTLLAKKKWPEQKKALMQIASKLFYKKSNEVS